MRWRRIQHQEVPFERLVEAVQPERSQSRHPLFQVALTLQNTPTANLNLPLLSTHVEVSEFNVAKFDLGFGLSELRSPAGDPLGIQGDISYSNDLFDETTVRSLATRLVRMLKEMVQAPETRLHRAKILSIEEKHILLETFNATAQEIPEATVSEMFEEQVTQHARSNGDCPGRKIIYLSGIEPTGQPSGALFDCSWHRPGITGGNRTGAFAGNGGGDTCSMEIRSSLPAA